MTLRRLDGLRVELSRLVRVDRPHRVGPVGLCDVGSDLRVLARLLARALLLVEHDLAAVLALLGGRRLGVDVAEEPALLGLDRDLRGCAAGDCDPCECEHPAHRDRGNRGDQLPYLQRSSFLWLAGSPYPTAGPRQNARERNGAAPRLTPEPRRNRLLELD